MSEEPITPEIVDEPDREFEARRNYYRRLAQASWLSAPIAVVMSIVLRAGAREAEPNMREVLSAIYSALFLFAGVIGIAAGIIALLNVRRYGRKGIFNPAVTSICIWCVIFALSIWASVFVKQVATRNKPTVLAPATHSPDATRVTDAELGFAVDIPNDFEPVAPSAMAADYRYAFMRRDDRNTFRTLLVLPMGGVLRREKPKLDDLPDSDSISVTTFNWRGLEVNGFRVPEEVNGVEYVTINVQIPLKNQGIQLGFVGPVDGEDELHTTIRQVLASLEGETNW